MTSRKLGVADATEAIEELEAHYPNAGYYLNFRTAVDLVAAAIISARTKDTVVNAVTPALFDKYRTADDYAGANPKDLEAMISRVSFPSRKAGNIIRTFRIIVNDYGGKVPDKREALTALPGIGSKTANTILINAFGIAAGIPVDTWVLRIAYRLGLSVEADQDRVEADLEGLVKKKYWKNIAYVMKAHGKELCRTSAPLCDECFLSGLCMRNGV